MVEVKLTFSASGTDYIRRCQASGVLPGVLPFGADGTGVGPEADNSPPAGVGSSSKAAADRTRDDWLLALGLKPQDLQSLSPADREALEARVRERVREHLANEPGHGGGAFVDVQA